MTRRNLTLGVLLCLTSVATAMPGRAQPGRLRVSDIDTIALRHAALRIAYGQRRMR